MKKIHALLVFAVALLCAGLLTVTASAADTASLYGYYDDDMLFRQNDDAVFAGTAPAGTLIDCVLQNSSGDTVASSQAYAGADGCFSLSFTAPAGSFEEYTVTLTADGNTFDVLEGVVFGELWLAGGQSNMQMSLISSETGYQMAVENKRGSDALRFFYIPYMGGAYNGAAENFPATPLTDYQSETGWYRGSDVKVFEMSAVGYYFAENLIAELGMPVGVLNANLGGTSILTWLSRETIESNPQVLAAANSDGRYIALNNWNETKVNFSFDMTCNFNKIIAPLKNFRLSGMIWYQGESDIGWQSGRYSDAFDALQASYTEYFSYDGESLPIVFTQLASYSYGDITLLQRLNGEFASIQQAKPDSRALTSILDVPLTYTPDVHAIHPLCKKEVGDKMAYAAMGLVYDRYDTYTTATVQNVQIAGDSIYVTFRDEADGLMADGDTIHGFSVCGADGVYVSADAVIVSSDTVKVSSEGIYEPVSVAYAYTQTNFYANLFASVDGEKALAVSPFVSDLSGGRHYWHNSFWADCDYASVWHCHANENSGFYNSWNASGAEISFAESTVDKGNAIYVKGTSSFSLMPAFTYQVNGKEYYFEDVDYNWSDYGTLSFDVKLTSGEAVEFSGLKLKINDSLWVMPAVADTASTSVVIPADGNVHTITLDLNRLYPYGNAANATYDSSLLSVVFAAEFMFNSQGTGTAELCFDDVDFTSTKLSYDNQDGSAFSFFEKIKAFFVSIYVKLVLFFENLF